MNLYRLDWSELSVSVVGLAAVELAAVELDVDDQLPRKLPDIAKLRCRRRGRVAYPSRRRGSASYLDF